MTVAIRRFPNYLATVYNRRRDVNCRRNGSPSGGVLFLESDLFLIEETTAT